MEPTLGDDTQIIRSPAAGIFEMWPPSVFTTEGELVTAGGLVGRVAGTDIRSPKMGWVMSICAQPGSHVEKDDALLVIRG